MKEYKTLRLILGDQLNREHSWLREKRGDVLYVLMEVRPETDYVRHHVQKVVAFFAGMRAFAEDLLADGHEVRYFRFDDGENKHSFLENVRSLVEKHSIEAFEYQHPDEYRLKCLFEGFERELGIPVSVVSSEHFLLEMSEIPDYFKAEKIPLMEFFYRKMRKRFDILMESNEEEPLGGKWNFDHLNRNKLPNSVEIPKRQRLANDVSDLVKLLEDNEVPTIGRIKDNILVWPINREQALQYLDDFLETSLHSFGSYQDALTDRDPFLFHSRISFGLNAKLISPIEVVDRTLAYWNGRKEEIDIAQVEGFIRQIIGWREYVRGVYWATMPEYGEMNELNHQAALPQMYWSGETKMKCMSVAINQSLDYAYAHHIQRLMITGSFALLLGVHPDEVDAWYLGIYIDAIEWVEMPNTRGMSQFADGGKVGTKPYISSANYIHKMGDHCKSCHYDHKSRVGKGACPFNSLYWEFYMRHEETFRNNPRVGMAYRHIDKMSDKDKEDILRQADYIRKNVDEL